MKIGVLSDTHGSEQAVKRVMSALKSVDAWIHLGDYASDSRPLKSGDMPVYAVRGNCDFDLSAPVELVITLGGVRLFLTHGHRYSAKHGTDTLFYRAEELNCVAVLFGHTHVPLVAASGKILAVNPGSASHPSAGFKPSAALLTVEKGDVSARIVTL